VRLLSGVSAGMRLLPNSHTSRFYRQAIPTGLAAEALVRR